MIREALVQVNLPRLEQLWLAVVEQYLQLTPLSNIQLMALIVSGTAERRCSSSPLDIAGTPKAAKEEDLSVGN